MSWLGGPAARHGRVRALLLARQVCWPALLWVVALGADAWRPPPEGALPWLWIDAAALLAVVWAAFDGFRPRRTSWSTCIDGRVLAGLVISLLQLFDAHDAGESEVWLRHIVPALAFYYALTARLRWDVRAAHAAWPAFALATFGLGGAAVWVATRGMATLGQVVRVADVNWVGHQSLGKALVFATILCFGRAC